jgi:hypothetical protein
MGDREMDAAIPSSLCGRQFNIFDVDPTIPKASMAWGRPLFLGNIFRPRFRWCVSSKGQGIYQDQRWFLNCDQEIAVGFRGIKGVGFPNPAAPSTKSPLE